MKDREYTFGITTVYCDFKGCNQNIDIDGFDGRPLPYSDVNDKMKEEGWSSRKENGEWKDFCPTHK